MDISFEVENSKFNYRVCAIIIHDNKLLAMRDDRSPYYYLPGGRVKIGETAEDAIKRELFEELCISAEIIRPLWLDQAFFNEDVDKLDYHELCIYFLIDIKDTDLLSKGEIFSSKEGKRTNTFKWLSFESLKREYFYPKFLKTEIYKLPDTFIIRTSNN